MRKIGLLVVFEASALTMFGEAPTPLSKTLKEIETAIIGQIEASRPLNTARFRSDFPPRQAVEFEPVYPCEFLVRVSRTVKSADSNTEPGTLISIISYVPSSTCTPGYETGPVLEGQTALWLLRSEHGVLRTWVDNASTVYLIQDPSKLAAGVPERYLGDPTVSLLYLFLEPGLIISDHEYSGSTLPVQMVDLAGWNRFLAVYREIYLHSTEYERRQIALAVASLGFCLVPARQAAAAEGKTSEWTTKVPLLDEKLARESDEAKAARMSWPSKEVLLRSFKSADAALDELTFRGCSSGPKVRQKARSLLSHYFGIEASEMPCVPCE